MGSPSKPKPRQDHLEKTRSPISRHVQPLGPRVLVRIVQTPDRLDSGLFLPQGAKQAQDQALLAEVIEVARAMPKHIRYGDDEDKDEAIDAPLGTNVSGVPLGSKVLFRKDHGVTVPWDETLRVVDVRHILAIVDEIAAEDIQ
ncbi:MAG: co-chaperone GroES [Myxococcales bacterium FL481]|nr:MAG: co-chaperone GroES [Myxococcales bacterium FL481]